MMEQLQEHMHYRHLLLNFLKKLRNWLFGTIKFFQKNYMWFSFVEILRDVFMLLRKIFPWEIIWFLGLKTRVVFLNCNLIRSLCVDNSDIRWYWTMTKGKNFFMCLCIVILRYLHVPWGFLVGFSSMCCPKLMHHTKQEKV
jgi:hypothetical protein